MNNVDWLTPVEPCGGEPINDNHNTITRGWMGESNRIHVCIRRVFMIYVTRIECFVRLLCNDPSRHRLSLRPIESELDPSFSALETASHAWIRSLRQTKDAILETQILIPNEEEQKMSSLSTASYRQMQIEQYSYWMSMLNWHATLHSASVDRNPTPLAFLTGTGGFAVDAISVQRFSSHSSWSTTQLRSFLHAVQSLDACATQLAKENARISIDLIASYELQNTSPCSQSVLDSCRIPLPFLIPWPVADGVGDEVRARRFPAVAPRVTEPVIVWDAIRWDEARPVESNDSIAALPLYYGAIEDLSNMSVLDLPTAVAHLSSSFRGCPWPLFTDKDECGTDDTPRVEAEQRLVARCIFNMMGIEQYEAWCAEQEWPRKRPVDNDAATSSDAAKYSSSTMPASRSSYWSNWLTSGDSDSSSPITPSTLSQVADLLPNSFVIGFGSETAVPWPRMVIAPIAPGWIGGFLSGADM